MSGQAEIAREAAAALKTNAVANCPRAWRSLPTNAGASNANSRTPRKRWRWPAPRSPADGDGARDDRRHQGRSCAWSKASSAKDLKGLADDAKVESRLGVVAFVAVADGKASLVVGVTDDLTSRISAVDLVRLGAEALGGKGGGGRPDMAQAGGPDGAKAADAIAAIEKRLSALTPAA